MATAGGPLAACGGHRLRRGLCDRPLRPGAKRLSRLEEACQILLALWSQPKTTFKGKYYHLDEAPLFPKPVQQPHPEFLIGGGGEQRTLKIAAKYADHWNVWGGPQVLRRKIRILEDHCATVGRDPASIIRSANMPLLFTDKREDGERLAAALMRLFGRTEADARDTVLAGSVAEVQETIGRLREVGVHQLFIPTFLPRWNIERLDRFMAEVAPMFR